MVDQSTAKSPVELLKAVQVSVVAHTHLVHAPVRLKTQFLRYLIITNMDITQGIIQDFFGTHYEYHFFWK